MVAVIVGGVGTANGQFIKRLGKKVQKAAERTVERRAERETQEKTDRALDEVLEPGERKEKGKDTENEAREAGQEGGSPSQKAQQAAMAAMLGGGSMDDVPDTYTFSYRATMKITHEDREEDTEIFYWIEPEAVYFGMEVAVGGAAGQVTVMDADVDGMVMFMDDGERKMAMRLSGNQSLMSPLGESAANESAGATVTAIEGKTVLGYRCKGYRIETEDGVAKVWVTEEAPVGMINAAFRQGAMADGLPDLGPKALFMEMEYTANNRNEDKVRMVCTELKPVSLTIHKDDYNTMTSPLGGR